jgi:hypothetical protein
MEKIRIGAVRWLVAIIVIHSGFLLASGLFLFWVNSEDQGHANVPVLWINVCFAGFIGSLLYFSRKAYVYLITGKVERIVAALTTDNSLGPLLDSSVPLEERLRSRLIGYYVYLIARPLGGFAIGPLVTMAILGGLLTLSRSATASSATLSNAGIYIVIVVAFIGGYTSSDLFDYLSKLSARLMSAKD